MSSLLGHVLGAEAALGCLGQLAPRAVRSRRAVWIAGILAVAPDLDVGLYLLAGRPEWLRPHETLSHSLLFVPILGFLGACFLVKARREGADGVFPRALAIFSAVAAVHLLLDFLSRTEGVGGVPLLWPFRGGLARCPVQLLPTAYYSDSDWGMLLHKLLLYWRTWVAMLFEAAILMPLLAAAWKRKLPAGTRWTLVGLSAAGLLASFLLYGVAGVL